MKTYKTYIYEEKPPWDKVPAAEINCFQWENEVPYRPESRAKMCFVKGEGIYILLLCREENPKAVFTETDDPIYKDSCLEVFLKLNDNGYINIETNANAVYLSEFGADRHSRKYLKEVTHLKPVVKPVKVDGFWGNEIFISFSLLAEIYPDLEMKFPFHFSGNFYKCGDETDFVHYGSFSPMGSLELGFHNPQLFAEFTVEEDRMNENQIDDICTAFEIALPLKETEEVRAGLINNTFIVKASNDIKYVIQKINTFVFKNPFELMNNISSVTHFLRKRIKESLGDPERETLRFLKTKYGEFCYIDKDGGAWRAYVFMDNSYTVNKTEEPLVFESAGAAFGRFMKRLNSFPAKELYETISDFHNTPKRYEAFIKSVEDDKIGRKKNCEEEIKFVIRRKDDMKVLIDLYESGMIPARVTHNDTKLNNILFDKTTNEAFCVIDLDTVMPGLSLYDFGDSIRSGANSAKEDETDLSKVYLNLDLFESYTKGYLSETSESLTQTEIDHLAFSVKIMTLECGMRFLTDYLDGDKYFKTEYPEHNLVRARNQLKLVSDIESKFENMKNIVKKYS